MKIENDRENTRSSMKNKYLQRRSSRLMSFSAELPNDVCEAFKDCLCAVKFSNNPSHEIRESILEVIDNVGIRDWKEMEELIYCYIAVNSAEVHGFIEDAFLSLCLSRSRSRSRI